MPTLVISSVPDLYSFVSLQETLQGAVHRLCATIKNEFTPNVLKRVKDALNNAVQQGCIVGFSDLTRFITKEDFAHVCVQRPRCSCAHLTGS